MTRRFVIGSETIGVQAPLDGFSSKFECFVHILTHRLGYSEKRRQNHNTETQHSGGIALKSPNSQIRIAPVFLEPSWNVQVLIAGTRLFRPIGIFLDKILGIVKIGLIIIILYIPGCASGPGKPDSEEYLGRVSTCQGPTEPCRNTILTSIEYS